MIHSTPAHSLSKLVAHHCDMCIEPSSIESSTSSRSSIKFVVICPPPLHPPTVRAVLPIASCNTDNFESNGFRFPGGNLLDVRNYQRPSGPHVELATRSVCLVFHHSSLPICSRPGAHFGRPSRARQVFRILRSWAKDNSHRLERFYSSTSGENYGRKGGLFFHCCLMSPSKVGFRHYSRPNF